MCTGKCSKFIGVSLYPFTLICIICNLILLFPSWSVEYVKDARNHLTPEVLYLGGIIGGGALVLIPAIHIQATGRKGCCNNRCGMFLSILFAAIGVVGSGYCFIVSVLGMVKGPVCNIDPFYNSTSNATGWGRPFDGDLKEFSEENYLFKKDLWNVCKQPSGVVEFNIILFSILLASSAIELVLCAIQMINGLFGCLCGACGGNKD
ncbi:transmembrane 4 L6 family member 5-like [Bombina bombina]|uniref:transmembrane 4 L6 family member 5-like n=1 Tax=Bombina bombina TaxID=8345 RepID=UPI00235AA925|nr:transmembrane 4 L6 family member 5-like [Bombina bombina]